ncbi:MAG: hypothetical protein LBL78_01480 [Prevotellaceae bacterium]|jgi:hypothetical protein|nr:hypothetical protein [Prevotellaceae bacterium]
MSTSQHLDASYLASAHPHIGQRFDVANLVISIVLIIVGITAFAGISLLDRPSSALGMTMMVTGLFLFLYGCVRLFRRLRSVVYLPTQSALRKHSLYFDLATLTNLRELVDKHNFAAVVNLRGSGSGNVRMDVLLSRCGSFAAVQLFQFIPYNYTPVSDIAYFSGDEAERFALFVRQSAND